MRVPLVSLFILMALSVKPQQPSFVLDRTQVYLIKLPQDLDSAAVSLRVLSKKGLPLPPYTYLLNTKLKQTGTFFYCKNATSQFQHIQLPFTIPSQTWVWFFNYDDHLLIVDDDLYVNVASKKNPDLRYDLPQAFDLIQENAFSLRALKEAQERNEKLLINQLSVPTFNDTTIEVRVTDSLKMPLLFTDIRFTSIWKGMKNGDSYSTEVLGYFYLNQLWLPIKTVIGNKYDGCAKRIVNFQLKKDCVDGGILPKNEKKYRKVLIKLVFKK